MENASAAAAFGLIAVSLLVYLVAARAGKKFKVSHPDDFFLARSRMAENDLGDAQIAYGLQMATVYPFFVWAASGVWLVPIVNTLMWGIGIGLFYWLLPKYRGYMGSSRTIHAFVGEINGAKQLRLIASSLSIIAFAGVMAFEIAYGATVFRVIFGGNQVIYYSVVAFLAAYLMAYVWSGGQTAILRTPQWQLVLAYAGLHLAVAFLLSQQLRLDSAQLVFAQVLAALVVALALYMLYTRGRSVFRAIGRGKWLTALLYVTMLASLSLMLFAILDQGMLPGKDTDVRSLAAVFSDGSLTTVLMLLTAICLPIFWQFVDLTNWQRMCSVGAQKPEEYGKAVQDGIREYLAESPLSWLLPLLLGLLAVATLPGFPPKDGDPFEAFLKALLDGSPWAQCVAVLLSAGIVGIFFSTADAALSAIGYAFAYDIWPSTRVTVDRSSLSASEVQSVVRVGKRFMVGVMLLVIVGFISLDAFFKQGASFIGLLFAFYTPIIAFTPAAMLPILTGQRPHWTVAATAMLLGAVLGVGIGIYSVFGDPNAQWAAAPVALLVSWTIYVVGMLVRRYKVISERGAA